MANRQFHDTVFRDYFSAPPRLLSLCNALLGTSYRDPGALTINTLQGTFFSNMKNDISCELDGRFLVLAEHQTTFNPNMPIRFFMYAYAHEVLDAWIAPYRRLLYGSKLIEIPSFLFFIFYDGPKEAPETQDLHLSTACRGGRTMLEVDAKFLNIRNECNKELKERCRYLKDYSTFVDMVDRDLRSGMKQAEAIWKNIGFCKDHDIMKDYLIEKESQVFDMLSFEWNEDEARAVWKEEAQEEGRIEGLRKGRQEGRQEGRREGRREGLLVGRSEMADTFALKMLRDRLPVDMITKYTELSPAYIEELGRKNGLLA